MHVSKLPHATTSLQSEAGCKWKINGRSAYSILPRAPSWEIPVLLHELFSSWLVSWCVLWPGLRCEHLLRDFNAAAKGLMSVVLGLSLTAGTTTTDLSNRLWQTGGSRTTSIQRS